MELVDANDDLRKRRKNEVRDDDLVEDDGEMGVGVVAAVSEVDVEGEE